METELNMMKARAKTDKLSAVVVEQISKGVKTIRNNFKNRFKIWLGLICLMLVYNSIAQAEEITLETLIDRQKVQDLITRYYFNFGGTPESFANFYV